MAVLKTRDTSSVILPLTANKPSSELGDYTILLYGEKKIGKTSFASMFPETFFLMFEPGGRGLEVKQMEIYDWKTFRLALTAIRAEPDYCKTIVIDTIDIMYERCFEFVCKEKGFEHPTDEGYGKGWDAIKKEFRGGVMELLSLGKGVVFISHAKVAAFTERGGAQFNKVIPTLPNSPGEFITGLVDNIWYYGYFGKHRYLKISGDDKTESGARMKNQFWVAAEDGTRTKSRVEAVSCGNSEEEAYANILKAFANQQTTDGEPAGRWGFTEKVNAFKK